MDDMQYLIEELLEKHGVENHKDYDTIRNIALDAYELGINEIIEPLKELIENQEVLEG